MNIDRLGRIDLAVTKHVETDKGHRIALGDILFNNTNSPALVGKTAYFDRSGDFAFSNHMTRLRAPRVMDARFLAIQLHRQWDLGVFQDLCSNHVNQASVSAGRLLEAVSVVIPPLPEQRRIVAAIEEQFSRLDAAEESLGRAARRVATMGRAARSLAVAEGKETSVGGLVEGIEAGKSFRCHPRPARGSEWGVIKVSAMTWGRFDEQENKAVISDDQVDPRWEIKPGDLLLSRANTTDYVGASVLVGGTRDRLLLSDKSMRIHPRADVDARWLNLALGAPEVRRQISAMATGTSDSMRNISQDKVRTVRVRAPGLEDQRRIAAEVERRLSVVDAISGAIRAAQLHSRALRRSILERAFRGELVPQDPSDEPASVLLERIRVERAAQPGPRRGRRAGVAQTS